MTTLGPWDDRDRDRDGDHGAPPPPPPLPPYGNPGGYYNASPPEQPKNRSWIKWLVGGIVLIIVLCLAGVIALAVIGSKAADEVTPVPGVGNVTTAPVTPGATTPVTPEATGIPDVDPGTETRASDSREKAYVSQLRSSNRFEDSVSDGRLLTAGYDICSRLRDGQTLPSIGADARASGLTNEQASLLVAGGVVYLCNDQRDKIPNS